MTTIMFYRQARRDGGIRTGIEVDGETVLSRFDEGGADSDPAIVWYVDVTCRGRSLPKDSERARRFLIEYAADIRAIMQSLSREIPAGVDPSAWPVRKSKSKGGLKFDVACSAVRRVDAKRLSHIVSDIAAHWGDLVESLAEVEA